MLSQGVSEDEAYRRIAQEYRLGPTYVLINLRHKHKETEPRPMREKKEKVDMLHKYVQDAIENVCQQYGEPVGPSAADNNPNFIWHVLGRVRMQSGVMVRKSIVQSYINQILWM